jgi:hypothetical protein
MERFSTGTPKMRRVEDLARRKDLHHCYVYL